MILQLFQYIKYLEVYIWSTKHHISSDNISVMETEQIWLRRKVKEAIHIRTHWPDLNRDDGYLLQPVYASLLSRDQQHPGHVVAQDHHNHHWRRRCETFASCGFGKFRSWEVNFLIMLKLIYNNLIAYYLFTYAPKNE